MSLQIMNLFEEKVIKTQKDSPKDIMDIQCYRNYKRIVSVRTIEKN